MHTATQITVHQLLLASLVHLGCHSSRAVSDCLHCNQVSFCDVICEYISFKQWYLNSLLYRIPLELCLVSRSQTLFSCRAVIAFSISAPQQKGITILLYMQCIWRTISLPNQLGHNAHYLIGRHFSSAKKAILSVQCFMMLHNTCGYKQCWCTLNFVIKGKITKPPNAPHIWQFFVRFHFIYMSSRVSLEPT